MSDVKNRRCGGGNHFFRRGGRSGGTGLCCRLGMQIHREHRGKKGQDKNNFSKTGHNMISDGNTSLG